MTVELFLRKRAARHAGEVGLFNESEAAAEDWNIIPIDTEVRAELATERNAAHLKFMWALAGKIADNTEIYLDKDAAMNGVDPPGLKILARHCKLVLNPKTGEHEIKPLSLKRLNNEASLRLLNRMIFVTTTQIIPGMDEPALRAEIDEMLRDKRQPAGETRDGAR